MHAWGDEDIIVPGTRILRVKESYNSRLCYSGLSKLESTDSKTQCFDTQDWPARVFIMGDAMLTQESFYMPPISKLHSNLFTPGCITFCLTFRIVCPCPPCLKHFPGAGQKSNNHFNKGNNHEWQWTSCGLFVWHANIVWEQGWCSDYTVTER